MKQKLLLKRVFLFMLLCMIGSHVAFAQTVGSILWKEEFKGANNSTTFSATNSWSDDHVKPTTFVDTDKNNLVYSSSDAMKSTASGANMNEAHVWLNKNTTGFFQVSEIKLYNATKVKVSWSQGGGSKLTVAYAFDGATNFTDLHSTTTAGEKITSSELDVTGHTKIALKFYRTSTKTNIRIDNLSLEVAEVGTTKTVSSLSATLLAKNKFKVGESFSASGMVVTATYDDNSYENISNYSMSIGDIPLYNGTSLNTVGSQDVTISYGGQTTTQTIHVGALGSLEINTPPIKTTYEEGETFDATGLVATATFSDGEETPTTWTEDVSSSCTFSPTTSDALHPANTFVAVSYTWGDVTKTANQTISVNAGAAYTVSFAPESGTCATTSLTEESYQGGVTLPAATSSIEGWEFAGWATEAVTNTTTKPTLYAAGDIYYPTGNTTLHAVYTLEGIDDSKYERATSLQQITSATQIAIVNSGMILDAALASVNAPTETDGKINAPVADNVWTLSGDNTHGYTLTSSKGKTLGIDNIPSSSANVTTYTTSAKNNKWLFVVNTTGECVFNIRNVNTYTGGKVASLEYYNSRWKLYTLSGNTYYDNSSVALKIYVPVLTAYNSNPTSAVVTPTVAFEAATVPTLYLQDGSQTFTRTASVTGIDKTVTYTSSDTDVATVDANGVVTAVGCGTTTITATVAAELGVNKEASAAYDITVKDASTIAGLKALSSDVTVVSFTADLTNAVVTYVKDNYAYLQDASGAVMMNYSTLGDDIIEEISITGAVSGKIKASNQIDCITEFSFESYDEGVVPAATQLTLAQIKAAGTEYDGKLVRVVGATVTGSIAATANSGASIKDGSKIDDADVSFNLYAPNAGVEVNAGEIGTFTGYVSIYQGDKYRLNLYDQTAHIQLTQAAPQDQTLSFSEGNKTFDIVEGDDNTYPSWSGQLVSGADGAVTYSVSGDNVATIDSENGTVTWTGTCGTATVTATAAATSVEIEGVTYPLKQTSQTYTITVRPRYTVTYYINGTVTKEVESSYADGVLVAEAPATLGDYAFMGWAESQVAPTDEAPALTQLDEIYKPTENKTFYAVYALPTVGGTEEKTSTLTLKTSSAPGSPTTINGVTWTYNNVSFLNDQNAGMPDGAVVSFTLPENATAKTFTITQTSNSWSTSNVSLSLTDSNSSEIKTFNSAGSYTFGTSDTKTGEFTLTASNQSNKVAYIDNIAITFEVPGITYADYRSNVDGSVTITKAGFNTWYMPYAVEVNAEEGSAFYVSDVDESHNVVFTKFAGNKIPANTGAVIRGSVGETVSYTVLADDVEFNAANMLLGSNEKITVTAEEDYYYFISGRRTLEAGETYQYDDTYKYGFLVPNSLKTGNTFVNNANKAYLRVSKNKFSDGEAKELMLVWEGEATGIHVAAQTPQDGQMYNLSGQKVGESYRGIVIVNGKKYLRK